MQGNVATAQDASRRMAVRTTQAGTAPAAAQSAGVADDARRLPSGWFILPSLLAGGLLWAWLIAAVLGRVTG